MWDNDSAVPVPNQEQMLAIVNKLTIMLKDNKFSKISFVLPIPAYYQFKNNNEETNQENRPKGSECSDKDSKCSEKKSESLDLEMLLVNRLNGSECLGLLSAELQYKGCSTKIIEDLKKEADILNITLERKLWIETFGMPKYVTDIVSKKQYDSKKAWDTLSKWWKQVY